jgi:diguanylate cyclase (GGDEF)-like protein
MSEVQLQMAMARAGVWLTYAVCGSGLAYALATWEGPNRALIVPMLAIGFASAAAIQLLPTEKVVRSTLGDAFFLAWSLLDVALIVAIVACDGGASSPYSFIFFLPLIFAALSYSVASFVVVGAADVLSYVAVSVTVGDADTTYTAFTATALAATAVMCAWQAQNHERQRGVLTVMSRSDPLTGCLNRRGFEERVEAELAQAMRSGQPLSLILLDLDGFKAVNDELGHAAGDELLRWVAAGIGNALRPMDSSGRIGGDEFAVLAPTTPRTGAEILAERTCAAIADRIAATPGIACFPVDGAEPEELYRHADRELYAAKLLSSSSTQSAPRSTSDLTSPSGSANLAST